MSRTNFHGPKDVRAIEVRLYIVNIFASPFNCTTGRSVLRLNEGFLLNLLQMIGAWLSMSVIGLIVVVFDFCQSYNILFEKLLRDGFDGFSPEDPDIITLTEILPERSLYEINEHITKTLLFNYIKNFISKNWKFSDKKTLIFFIFLLKT